ncbi:MAG TPA: hypothetical protein VFE03_07505, partial [Caulobacteraceae bacterium]|nr:hypothetical protein [Caulobacteraceae bacterium]
RAWALMAHAQAYLHYSRGKGDEDGLTAAEKALALDPALAEPHAVKAQILLDRDGLDEALVEMETAVRLDPESYLTNRVAGRVYTRVRRLEDAIRHYAKAAALDETDFACSGLLGSILLAVGDAAGARQAAHMTLARVEKAIANDPNNGHAIAYGVGALATLGEAERAKEWMERALLIDPDNMMMRYNFACALSADLHEFDAAIDMLGLVLADVGVGFVNHAKVDPDLDPIRDDPRFQQMIAETEARLASA